MDRFVQDLKAAARRLRKSPAFTLAAASTLAIALGANTAIFSVVNAVLLRPVPGVEGHDRLVYVHGTRHGGDTLEGFSYPEYLDYRDRNTVLNGLAAFNGRGMSLGAGGSTELVAGQLVSGNYFLVLGTRPRLGRLLGEEDDRRAAPVAVISHGLWQRRFGGDASIVGRAVSLNGIPFTVVGVGPERFIGHYVGFAFDVFVPLSLAAQVAPGQSLARRDAPWLELVGRLREGGSEAGSEAALDAIAATLAREHPGEHKGSGIDVRPFSGVDDNVRAGTVAVLAVLATVAVLVLLIACVNLAGILLARGVLRGRELALRAALGAGRAILVRQLLTETLLLFAVGGALGALLAYWTVDLLPLLMPRILVPLQFDLRLDHRVLLFTAAVTAAAGLLFGLAPALQASRVDLVAALKASGPTAPLRRSRLRGAFVVGQVALSVLLLTAAGLFVRTLQRARGLDIGFDVDAVQLVRLDLGILPRDEAAGRLFYSQLLERVANDPRVRSASLVRFVPLGLGAATTRVHVPGHEEAGPDGVSVGWNVVSPSYFETLRLPLLAGRAVAPSDDERAPAVAVVNEAMVRRFWPGEVPIGRRFGNEGRELVVVGVARDSAYHRVGERPTPHFYVPFAQRYNARMSVIARPAADPTGVAALLRREVRGLDRDLPILDAMPLAEFIAIALLPQRVAGTVAGMLGAVGLLLAGVGIYAVTAAFVAQRTREIGVRLAVGAALGDVVRLVLREGLGLAAAGVAVGGIAAAATTRLLRGLLPGVSPTDPATFAVVAALMAAAALGACAVPAWRAARVDPTAALRAE